MSPLVGLMPLCRKTKLCRFHLLRKCTRGASCNFAHSEEDLQAVPDLSRTKLCPKLLARGFCDIAQCTFAHSKEELRNFDATHLVQAHRAQLAAVPPPKAEHGPPPPVHSPMAMMMGPAPGTQPRGLASSGQVFPAYPPVQGHYVPYPPLPMPPPMPPASPLQQPPSPEGVPQGTEEPVKEEKKIVRRTQRLIVKNTFLTVNDSEEEGSASETFQRLRRIRTCPETPSEEAAARFLLKDDSLSRQTTIPTSEDALSRRPSTSSVPSCD